MTERSEIAPGFTGQAYMREPSCEARLLLRLKADGKELAVDLRPHQVRALERAIEDFRYQERWAVRARHLSNLHPEETKPQHHSSS